MNRLEAQKEYEETNRILYPTGSSINGLDEPRGIWACGLIGYLDELDSIRRSPVISEDYIDPFPQGTAKNPEALAKQIRFLGELGQEHIGKIPPAGKQYSRQRSHRK